MCEAQNQILEVFWWFDDKGRGVITRRELARVLKSLGPDWDDSQVERLVQLAGPDCDGLIKYREFVAWLMGGSDQFSEAQRGCCEPAALREAGASALEAKQREAGALAGRLARDSQRAERAAAEANGLFEAALPALDAAAEALDSLEDEALVELAAAREPPSPSVAAIAACLCALRPLGGWDAGGEAGASAAAGPWAEARGLLAAPGLRARLRDYNKDGVRAEQVETVRQLLRQGGDLLSDDAAQQLEALSVAGCALLLWVKAVVCYFEAAKAAKPKFELVNTLHQGMWQTEAALSRVNEEVEALMA